MGASKWTRTEARKIFFGQNQFYLEGWNLEWDVIQLFDDLSLDPIRSTELKQMKWLCVNICCLRFTVNEDGLTRAEDHHYGRKTFEELFQCIRRCFQTATLMVRFVFRVAWKEDSTDNYQWDDFHISPSEVVRRFCTMVQEANIGTAEVLFPASHKQKEEGFRGFHNFVGSGCQTASERPFCCGSTCVLLGGR